MAGPEGQMPFAFDQNVVRDFSQLPVAQGKVMAEYIWIGGTGSDLHSKTKVLDFKPTQPEQLPLWHFDGSATGQAPEHCGVVYMKPRALFPDPFRGGDHVLVLCDTFTPPTMEEDGIVSEMQPHPTNNRAPCEKIMAAAAFSDPVFAVEQQYTLLHPGTMYPIGWPERGGTEPSTHYYCSAGAGSAIGREFAESHVRACLSAGIKISGVNAEVAPGQWAYQVGPCRGLELGDQLWLSRYLLLRVTEKFNVVASIDPKPVPGDWGGSGAPVKYSTRETREQGKGWFALQGHIRRLQAAHMQHIMVYGAGNDRRLTGSNRTSSVMHFTWGLESRSVSVRIPHSVLLKQRGYLEDRRPASNMDPYLVTMMLVCTTLDITLPSHMQQSMDSDEESVEISRGSSAILDELEELDSFAPDTPPQNHGLLAAECSSQNYASPSESCYSRRKSYCSF